VGISRRNLFLGTASAALAATPLAGLSAAKRRNLRVCFFTDAHLPGPATHETGMPAAKFMHQKRVRAAFDRANRFRPDLFVFGGDNVFAVDQGNDEANATSQFTSWKNVVAEKVKVTAVTVIGNHDIWYPKEGNPKDRKAMAVEAFRMPNRFYAQSVKGWRFILLDVFHSDGSKLDVEQMAWLESELRKVNEPVCVVTHAPILSITTQLEGGAIGGTKKLRDLFRATPEVRLALSGHQHMLDCCEMDQVTYLCGGAVSGAWWGGDYNGFAPAFCILDLFSDGSVSSQTVLWEPNPPKV